MAETDIAIGLPFGGRLIHPRWAAGFYIMDFPLHTKKSLIMVEKRPIDQARNAIVQTALEQNAKYLFFLDDDVICPKYTPLALGSILETMKDDGVMLATGIYCTKNKAAAPVIFRHGFPGSYLDWTVNQEFEVDQCGAGCLMINMEVFKHLTPPYFKFTQKYEQLEGDILLTGVSEDVYFCDSVKKAGFKIYAHGAVLCKHYSNEDDKFYELSEDSPPYKRELQRQQEEVERQKEKQEV